MGKQLIASPSMINFVMKQGNWFAVPIGFLSHSLGAEIPSSKLKEIEKFRWGLTAPKGLI
ncbi:hypothetical protein BKP37_02475 [Anaerobacillus alkalilacustris]|uniref:Uncharacterized protein n=1 Tax=Anaerobacillus alkalilacustris TaxID=393763 RepID=A0A1S2LXZ5_9BACI|nr:hypothetical protein BKP37_02475 [Anaerobacillus alkalilacustris]